jgi:hypothetical protein
MVGLAVDPGKVGVEQQVRYDAWCLDTETLLAISWIPHSKVVNRHLGSIGDINWLAEVAGFGAISSKSRGWGGAGAVLVVVSLVLSWLVVVSASGAMSLLPSVTRRFSRPSTRFKRASRTSVFGPLFLGTASRGTCQLLQLQELDREAMAVP